MSAIPENIKAVARFILLHLQRTFDDIGLQDSLRSRAHRIFINENFNRQENENVERSAYDTQVLNQGLAHMALHLPAVLYNAGLTKTIIPASNVHSMLVNNLLGVHVNDVGTFIIDVEKGGIYAFSWPSENRPAQPAKAPSPAKTATHDSSIRFINTDPDLDAAVQRNMDYLTEQMKGKIKGAVPKAPTPVNLLKHRNLVKSVSEMRQVYKGLYKDQTLVEGILEGSPMNMLKDMATRKPGEGNLPGIDYVPGATQLLDILFNDGAKGNDLLFIDVAQRTPPESGGGYKTLIKMLDAYNRHWGRQFVGAYVSQEMFNQYQSQHSIPAGLPFTGSFDSAPRDRNGHPYKYFIYINIKDLKTDNIDLKKAGVILINPQD
ncbi:hypothetical protein ECE50_013975 [Chitinophaga sp. Mgbs1]|uniref:Uncharacterized protein n=1 Tax=Chitinophaga solisilvae TaxID=1233460 RepID=A0A433WEV0_9BACT|nr:hypothetical protein [Chitinophaga solisilvae]